jgi:GNAT superfamily N-acetyltransferase
MEGVPVKPIFEIVEMSPEYSECATGLIRDHWGAPEIVTRGKIHDTSRLPGFIAVLQGEPAGLVTYSIHDEECEMVSLDSLVEGIGIGSALVGAAARKAKERGCRLFLPETGLSPGCRPQECPGGDAALKTRSAHDRDRRHPLEG